MTVHEKLQNLSTLPLTVPKILKKNQKKHIKAFKQNLRLILDL